VVAFSSALAALALLSYASVASAQEKETGNDHDQVVGRFGVGYFGISNLPVGGGAPGNGNSVTQETIVAPVIGARYWLMPKLGIDAGVGFSASSPGWGFAVHAGLPIALATSKHLTFELIPEPTVAFAGNSDTVGNTSITYSGFRLNVGARIGGEIQFGFIGIPQLALQGTVGLYVEHDSWGASTNSASGSGSSTIFTTSVGSDPWGIFTDNISALYYF
jgi:hypothetical protein